MWEPSTAATSSVSSGIGGGSTLRRGWGHSRQGVAARLRWRCDWECFFLSLVTVRVDLGLRVDSYKLQGLLCKTTMTDDEVLKIQKTKEKQPSK